MIKQRERVWKMGRARGKEKKGRGGGENRGDEESSRCFLLSEGEKNNFLLNKAQLIFTNVS